MELAKAKNLADEVIMSLGDSCIRAHIAGSIRREKENVKDIEIVAIVKDYDDLFNALRKHGRFIKPGTPDIIDWPAKKDAKYLRMFLNEEVKLDFFIANKENWGSLFAMRTGPAVAPEGEYPFVPALFSAWKRASGGGCMHNCLPTMPDGSTISVPEEEDFFRVCGVEWLPPRDRTSARAIRKLKN